MGFVALLYGSFCYLAFLAAFGYLVGFVGDLGVPRSVSLGPPAGAGAAALGDAGLLALFALQHSLMARPACKRILARILPDALERSTYVLASSLALGLLFRFWRPLPAPVWELANPLARGLLWALFWAGVLLALASTFLISHADLFGLGQAWRRFRGRPEPERGFQACGLYRHVRHPLMSGFLLAFWATPRMTLGHLLFAVAITGYILAGTWLEERDLVRTLGPAYGDYRRRVPRFIPWPRRRN